MSVQSRAFAEAAERLVGVPFRFRGRDCSTGLDCVGMVAKALDAAGVVLPRILPYAMRQRDFSAQLGSASEIFDDVDDGLNPGDLLLLRPGPAQMHLAVVANGFALIHAHAALGKVVSTPPPCPWPVERHWRLRDN
jgi:cell wall-associated NlpC family hydrolase